MTPSAALHTLGCKLNFSETSAISKQFLEHGYVIVSDEERADVYVINTCTVTGQAERECRQVIRRFLRKNPDAFIIVTGCYAQLRPEEIAAIEGVDLVLGHSEKFRPFDFFETLKKNRLACISISPLQQLDDTFGAAFSSESDGRTRAFLKIQDGCDYKCSFCTIPLARGGSRSMPSDQVVDQFGGLLNSGYKEIILTGVNVGDYGISLESGLTRLVHRLTQFDADYRIRISSIEPNLVTPEIIRMTAENEKLCKHFHIPLQSGSDTVLRRMQRRYDTDYYADLIHRIKDSIPDAGIGVDVITGFPGESEEDFQTTLNFLHSLPISYLHVFTYSERPETKALDLPNPVSVFERRERTRRLRMLGQKKKAAFLRSMIGKEERVLLEQYSEGQPIKGFTSNYCRFSMKGAPELDSQFRTVHITESDAEQLYCDEYAPHRAESVIPR